MAEPLMMELRKNIEGKEEAQARLKSEAIVSDEQLAKFLDQPIYELPDDQHELYRQVWKIIRGEVELTPVKKATLERVNEIREGISRKKERRAEKPTVGYITKVDQQKRRDQQFDDAARIFTPKKEGELFESKKAEITFNSRNDFNNARPFLERQRGFRLFIEEELRIPRVTISSDSLLPMALINEIRKMKGVVEPRR